MSYYVGSLVRLSAVFLDLSGMLADPTTVTVLVLAPDGTSASYSGSKDSTGKYHYDLPVTSAGTWLYEWSGAGAVIAVQPGDFEVLPFPTPAARTGFSYNGGANPQIDYPRMLIGDTADLNHYFEDSEVLAFYQIQQMQFQSSMFYSGTMGQILPSQPVSYLRVAALMLDALASSKAGLMVAKLLDADLSPQAAAKALHAQAEAWREVEDNSGAFMIIEQCHTTWGFLDRYYHQIQRQTAL